MKYCLKDRFRERYLIKIPGSLPSKAGGHPAVKKVRKTILRKMRKMTNLAYKRKVKSGGEGNEDKK